MFGVDLSNHQKGIDLSRKNFDFGIVKATEGVTYKDPSFESHIKQLETLHKCIGCYHFARPDNQNTISSMEKSADHFLKVIGDKGLIGQAILVLDWEREPVERTDLLEAWLNRVYDRTQITPFLYANSSFIRSRMKVICNLGVPLWVASWPNFSVMREWPDYFFIDEYNPFSTGWKIWQFSSNGTWPCFKGRVDYNYTRMTEGAWNEYASKPVCKEAIPENMKWAINMGIIKGFPDGSARPDAPLTRNQFVTALRRYDQIIKEAYMEWKS